MNDTQGNGKNVLFNDSKLGVLVTGGLTVVINSVLDGAIEALTSVDTSGWNGWWTLIASAVLGTGLGTLTAYKAKRNKTRLTD